MPQTVDQIVHSLSHSGLLSAAEVQAAVQRLGAWGRFNATDLSRELLKRGLLTAWQADAVARGDLRRLMLGDYVLLDEIGSGSMGRVLKARQRRMGRIVAVKVLDEFAAGSPDLVRRFQREVKAAAMLEHTNIVTAYDAGETDGAPYLVMQYIDGGDLRTLVETVGPLPLPQAVSCILDAARGLQYAHAKGVVHRDIKPANLLLDRQGVVRVLDLGLARIIEGAGDDVEPSDGRLTRAGEMFGTPDYIAPEQVADTRRADARSDIYSLGCSLFYLVNGRPPYPEGSLNAVLIAHQTAPVPPLCPPADNAAEVLDEVYRLMVAKNPAERYQSVDELIFDLELDVFQVERPQWPARPGGAEFPSTVAPHSAQTMAPETGRTVANPAPAAAAGETWETPCESL